MRKIVATTALASAALAFAPTASAAPPIPENPQVQIDTVQVTSGCTIQVNWTWANARGGRQYSFAIEADRGSVGRSLARLKDGSTAFSAALGGEFLDTETPVFGIVTDAKTGEQVGTRIPATIDGRVPVP